jgi:hypothetical protein
MQNKSAFAGHVISVSPLSRELASQANSSEGLMTVENRRNSPNQPLFSIITANAAIMER